MEKNIKNEKRGLNSILFSEITPFSLLSDCASIFIYSCVCSFALKLINSKYKYNVRYWKKKHIKKDVLIKCKNSIMYKKFNRLLKEFIYCIRTIQCTEVSEEILNYRDLLLYNLRLIEYGFSTEIERHIDETLERSIELMQECKIYSIKRMIKKQEKVVE